MSVILSKKVHFGLNVTTEKTDGIKITVVVITSRVRSRISNIHSAIEFRSVPFFEILTNHFVFHYYTHFCNKN